MEFNNDFLEDDLESGNDIEIKFCRRSGCESLGKKYEIKMTVLLAIRCAILQDTECMWIGSNVGHVGDFDDVVICRVTSTGEYIAYLVQLKHQENPKKINRLEFIYDTSSQEGKKTNKYKMDFSLFKYQDSYNNIKAQLESLEEPCAETSDIIKFLKKCQSFYLILYTNRSASNCNFLTNSTNSSLQFLNTESSQNTFKFNNTVLQFGETFLDHLILLTNQTHLKDTDKLIESEIKSFLSFTKIGNTKVIAQEFIAFVRNKIEHASGETAKKLCTLSKADVINKIISLALQPFMIDFFNEDYSFYSCSKKLLWNEMVQEKTVTVIDSDDFILQFLKSYAGTIMKKYVQDELYWSDFLILPKELDNHMLTTKKEVTLFDAYQSLWFREEAPLLLQIKSCADYHVILKLLEQNRNLKVIIIKPEILNLPKIGNVFSALTDIDPNIILDQNVELQGRTITMKTVINNSEYKQIKCRDIIYILSGCYKIGYQYEIPANYQEQGLSKIYLDYSVLSETKDDEFIVKLSNGKSERLSKSKKEKVVHYLKPFDEFTFEWLRSDGEIENIYQYRKNLSNNFNACTDLSNPVNIICANAGMGKSEFLNFLALQTNTNLWVLKVNLRNYEDNFPNSYNETVINLLNSFNKSILDESDTTNKAFSQMIFKKFVSKKKVLVLMDGFDEISVYFKDEVTHIAKCLVKEGYKIFITTRPVMKTHLEKAFGTFAYTLQPLLPESQYKYLNEYYKLIKNCKNDEKVDQFSNILFKNFSRFPKFTENPLFLKFVADEFLETYEVFLLSTDKFCFTVNYLIFEKFKDRMTEILSQKFGEDYTRLQTMLKKYQKLAALNQIFPKKQIKSLNIEGVLSDYFNSKGHESGLLQSEGIITLSQFSLDVDEKFEIEFVHPIFADLFAAQWLVENYDASDHETRRVALCLYKLRFTDFNINVFECFDTLLSRNSSFKKHKIDGQELDLGGRSIFHLYALANATISFPIVLSINKDDVETLEKSNQAYVDKDKFGYSPLDYALKSCNMALAEYFCQFFKFSLNIQITETWRKFYFSVCITYGFEQLFSKLLLFTASKALLLEDILPETQIETFCGISDQTSKIFLHGNSNKTLFELFDNENTFDFRFAIRFGNTKKVDVALSDVNRIDQFNNSLLYYAAKFNQLGVLQLLLSNKADVNQGCEDGNTALHLAAKAGNFEAAVIILEHDADFTLRNNTGQTPIFFAVKQKHLKLLNLLAQMGSNISECDINGNFLLHLSAENNWIEFMEEFSLTYPELVSKQNGDGRTPLMTALMNGHVDYAKLLLSRCASVDQTDKNGNTALHIASKFGQNCILIDLASIGGEINIQNMNGETPLLVAVKNEQRKTADLLITLRADYAKVDKSGNSVIHCVIKMGWNDFMQKLLSSKVGEPFNSTFLHTALLHNRVEIAHLLIESNVDIFSADGFGNTGLHYAAYYPAISVVSKFISKEIDVNATNNFKRTPLHYAVINNQEEIVKLLLAKDAKKDVIDFYSKTPADYANELNYDPIVSLLQDKNFKTSLKEVQRVDGIAAFKLLIDPIMQNQKSCKPKRRSHSSKERDENLLNKENLLALLISDQLRNTDKK